ncbi:hypothetical protein HDV00_009447, partial [Rhizophlyctis rosea]
MQMIFSIAALTEFATSLKSFITTSSTTNTTTTAALPPKAPTTSTQQRPLNAITTTLRKALTDFSWTASHAAILPSPAKLRRATSSTGTCKITNYAFLLGKTPGSLDELAAFVGAGNGSRGGTGGENRDAETLDARVLAELDRYLDIVQGDFMGLWEGYMEKKIGLSWIDIGVQTCLENSFSAESVYIQTSLSTILSSYAGGVIPSSLLVSPSHPLSFSKVFGMFRNKSGRMRVGGWRRDGEDGGGDGDGDGDGEGGKKEGDVIGVRILAFTRPTITTSKPTRRTSDLTRTTTPTTLPFPQTSNPITPLGPITLHPIPPNTFPTSSTYILTSLLTDIPALLKLQQTIRAVPRGYGIVVELDVEEVCDAREEENPFLDVGGEDGESRVVVKRRTGLVLPGGNGWNVLSLPNSDDMLRTLLSSSNSNNVDSSFSDDVYDMWFPSPDHDHDHSSIPERIHDFLFAGDAERRRGVVKKEEVEEIERVTFGVWERGSSGRRGSVGSGAGGGKGGVERNRTPRTPAKHNASPHTPSRLRNGVGGASSEGDLCGASKRFGSVEKVEEWVRGVYWEGVWGVKTLESFLTSLRTVEEACTSLRPSATSPLHLLVTLLTPLPQLEEKYRLLGSVAESSHWDDVDLADGEKEVAGGVLEGVKEGKRRGLVGRGKIREAQLQILILLHCLHLHSLSPVSYPLPTLPFTSPPPTPSPPRPTLKKRKSSSSSSSTTSAPAVKKRRSVGGVDSVREERESEEGNDARKLEYERVIEEVMDRVCVWCSLGDLESSSSRGEEGGLDARGFIEGVVKPSYDASLPDLVEKLEMKAGGGWDGFHSSSLAPTSPFFKKRVSVSKTGSGMGGGRRGGAAIIAAGSVSTRGGNVVASGDAAGSESSTVEGRKGRAAVTEILKRMAGKQVV